MKEGKKLFGLMLKRKEKGLTQGQLGKLVGVRGEAIYCYEAGVRRPDLEMLRKLAEVLECSIDDIT